MHLPKNVVGVCANEAAGVNGVDAVDLDGGLKDEFFKR